MAWTRTAVALSRAAQSETFVLLTNLLHFLDILNNVNNKSTHKININNEFTDEILAFARRIENVHFLHKQRNFETIVLCDNNEKDGDHGMWRSDEKEEHRLEEDRPKDSHKEQQKQSEKDMGTLKKCTEKENEIDRRDMEKGACTQRESEKNKCDT
ncbi:hypothetical protein RFI_34561 [Reticulomyxa filosa]|uniref:Uncharacterized protein n=1 Tax=Reticulomyxa filosa TaxID=46433 RepID=X6LNY5_RETFI|nr:hypothetical protein RFI_34561 [Reticulomyxa filosa]|eukprot:ETO02852.1 hypothetical protein RFI_34561 [Reticulomyxa filosa]